MLGFGGIAGLSIEIAKIIFFVAVVLFLISAVVGLFRGRIADRPVSGTQSAETRSPGHAPGDFFARCFNRKRDGIEAMIAQLSRGRPPP